MNEWIVFWIMVSCDSKYDWDGFASELDCRPKCAYERAQNWQQEDFDSLFPREEKWRGLVEEQVLLDRHRESNKHTNHDSHQTRGKHKKQSFVEVEPTNSTTCESNGTKHSNFLGLLVEVGGHGGLKGEEAKEHHYSNHDVEHQVQ